MITSAALIMVFVFSSFLLNGNPVVKQFSLRMVCAIAMDAPLVALPARARADGADEARDC